MLSPSATGLSNIGRVKLAAGPTGETGKATGVIARAAGGGTIVPTAFEYLAAMQPPDRWANIAKMLSDDAVKAAFHAVVMPILSAPLLVEPGTDDDLGNEMANFVRADIEGMTVALHQHRWEVASHISEGVSVFEKVFEVREDKKIHLRKLAVRPNASLIEWQVDDHGGPAGVLQLTDDGAEIQLDIDRLLIFSHQRSGANIHGQSIFRSAYKPWYYKDLFERIAAIAGERGAVGVPVGTQTGDDEDVADAIDSVLQNIRAHDSGFVREIEGVFKFRVEGMGGNLVDLEPAIARCTRAIWVSILADFLALGSGGAGGSWALSRDKSSFFVMVLRSILENVEDTYRTHLVRPWMQWNFGDVPAESLPRIVHGPLNTRDVTEWFGALTAAVEKGIIPADEQVQEMARDMLGLPEPATEEDAGGVAVAPVAGVPGGDSASPQSTLNGAQITSLVGLIQAMGDGPGQLPQATVIEIIITAFALPRERVEEILGIRKDPAADATPAASPLTADEAAAQQPNEPGDAPQTAAIVQQAAAEAPRLESLVKIEALGIAVRFSEIEDALDRGEQRIIDRVAKLQAKQAKRLAARGAKIVKDEAWDQLSAEELPSAEEAAAIEAELLDLYGMGEDEYGRELTSQKVTPAAVPAEDKGPSRALIAAFALFAGKRLADRMLNAWGAAVLQGGRGSYDAAAVGKAIGDGGGKLLADLARQGASTAAGLGRADAAATNGDQIKGELYSTRLDGNVCGFCSQYEGTEWAIGEGPSVPNPDCEGGPRCRCIRVPIVAR
jgi:hypothetical protein